MKLAEKPACPRLFEAEALRDGRLTGVESARFQAHAAGCRACALEIQALDALAERLRSSAPDRADELSVRRERTRLLAAFDAALVPQPMENRARRWRVAGALAATLLVSMLALVALLTPAKTVGPASPAGELAAVHAEASAEWSRRVEGVRETIELRSGSLTIHVDAARTRRRLLVVLPDGELEDIGTTFTVSARDGRTTAVSVEHGSVVLRLRGKEPLVLGRGDVWEPAPAPTATPSPIPEPPRAPVASAVPTAARFAGERVAARSLPTVRSAAARSVAVPGLDAAAEFRSATSALEAGANARAAALFSRFLERLPRDARAEDAAYLRVLALHRAGDAVGARRAAEDYLVRFPRGFRRAEVDALAR